MISRRSVLPIAVHLGTTFQVRRQVGASKMPCAHSVFNLIPSACRRLVRLEKLDLDVSKNSTVGWLRGPGTTLISFLGAGRHERLTHLYTQMT